MQVRIDQSKYAVESLIQHKIQTGSDINLVFYTELDTIPWSLKNNQFYSPYRASSVCPGSGHGRILEFLNRRYVLRTYITSFQSSRPYQNQTEIDINLLFYTELDTIPWSLKNNQFYSPYRASYVLPDSGHGRILEFLNHRYVLRISLRSIVQGLTKTKPEVISIFCSIRSLKQFPGLEQTNN